MHQVAMVVHPLTPLVEIVIERIGIGEGLPQVGQGLVVRFRRPVRVHVNRRRFTHSALSGSRSPPGNSLRRGGLRRRVDAIQHADRGSRTSTNSDEIAASDRGCRASSSEFFFESFIVHLA